MKKILIGTFLTFTLCLSTTVLAANQLTCKDIVGIWQGTLQGNPTLNSVALDIEDTGGNSMEDANMAFSTPDGMNISYGLLQGTCQQNKDGSITMNLNRNSYSISSSITTKLLSPKQLAVISFSYSDPWDNYAASGTLNKS